MSMGLSLMFEDEDEDDLLSDIHFCAVYLEELDAFAVTAGVKTLGELGAAEDPKEGDEASDLTFFPAKIGQKTLRALLKAVKTKAIDVKDDEEQSILEEELEELLTAMDDAASRERQFRFAVV